MLLEVVMSLCPFSQRTPAPIVSEVNVEDVSLVLPLGGEFLAAVLAGVHRQGALHPQHGIGAHLARQPLSNLMLVLDSASSSSGLISSSKETTGKVSFKPSSEPGFLGGQLFNL